MSYMLPHLTNGWQVDQAIQHEEDKVSIKMNKYSYKIILPLDKSHVTEGDDLD